MIVVLLHTHTMVPTQTQNQPLWVLLIEVILRGGHSKQPMYGTQAGYQSQAPTFFQILFL